MESELHYNVNFATNQSECSMYKVNDTKIDTVRRKYRLYDTFRNSCWHIKNTFIPIHTNLCCQSFFLHESHCVYRWLAVLLNDIDFVQTISFQIDLRRTDQEDWYVWGNEWFDVYLSRIVVYEGFWMYMTLRTNNSRNSVKCRNILSSYCTFRASSNVITKVQM